MVVPYKRHCMETIEKIICGDTKDICCEESTIRRIREWWIEWKVYFEMIIASLREKYGVYSENPAPREMIRAAANTNLWPATRTAFLSG